jgi:hypothetical protein
MTEMSALPKIERHWRWLRLTRRLRNALSDERLVIAADEHENEMRISK